MQCAMEGRPGSEAGPFLDSFFFKSCLWPDTSEHPGAKATSASPASSMRRAAAPRVVEAFVFFFFFAFDIWSCRVASKGRISETRVLSIGSFCKKSRSESREGT